eukprot:scaffold300534_cov28-Tisochrysis_lutea.AAC.1
MPNAKCNCQFIPFTSITCLTPMAHQLSSKYRAMEHAPLPYSPVAHTAAPTDRTMTEAAPPQ